LVSDIDLILLSLQGMKPKPKYFAIVLILFVAGIYMYVQVATRNSIHMTGRQKLLKVFYPVLMSINKLFGSNNSKIKTNMKNVKPQISFYSLDATSNNGTDIPFDQFKGKKVLLVNTASNCGYTGQYDELQKLYAQFRGQLVILGFPANDFGEQEKGTDEEIASFCKVNYGVSFPMAKKSRVVRGADQNKVFEWLTNKNKNGWNDQQPVWNFSKYLVNEKGELTNYFDPSISPLSSEVIAAIGQEK